MNFRFFYIYIIHYVYYCAMVIIVFFFICITMWLFRYFWVIFFGVFIELYLIIRSKKQIDIHILFLYLYVDIHILILYLYL